MESPRTVHAISSGSLRGLPSCAALPLVARDLRGGSLHRGWGPHGAGPRGAGPGPAGPARSLNFPSGDRVVVSGLPGSGKSTLIRRSVAGQTSIRRVDSQDMRERWAGRMPWWLPYVVYRPLVRIAHYAALAGALASRQSTVVHDCGSQGWVRRWLAVDARRRGRGLHLVLLDVSPDAAREGQTARGRRVSRYAFARHRRAVRRLVAEAETGRPPAGCASVVLLDRPAAEAVRSLVFEERL